MEKKSKEREGEGQRVREEILRWKQRVQLKVTERCQRNMSEERRWRGTRELRLEIARNECQ